VLRGLFWESETGAAVRRLCLLVSIRQKFSPVCGKVVDSVAEA